MTTLLILVLLAQTRVDPVQIIDPNQIRLDAAQQGTRISPDQLSDGRHVRSLGSVPWMRPRWPGVADATRVVCFASFVRVRGENSAIDFCFGASDQATWLSDPQNAMWFGEQR